MAIRQVEQKNPLLFQTAHVKPQCLLRQKVCRDAVAAEGVYEDEIVQDSRCLRLFQGESAIADDDQDIGRRVSEVGEFLPGNPFHIRIDFIVGDPVALSGIGPDRAGAETDGADPPGWGEKVEDVGQSACRIIVECRQSPPGFVQILNAVKGG